MLTALPLPEASASPRREVSSSSSSGEREPRVDSQEPFSIVGHFVGAFTLMVHHRDFRGIYGVQPLAVWL